MHRLTREVRFAVNSAPDAQLAGKPANSYGGFPALVGAGQYYALGVTIAGALDGKTQYLCDIKEIDQAVRRRVIPTVGPRAAVDLRRVYDLLQAELAGRKVDRIDLSLTPQLTASLLAEEYPMTRLSQTFEFCASHRLHNPALSDEENRRLYGKCNNPHGHGHNYALQVTVGGPGPFDLPALERTVAAEVIERFDHKNLNVELTEFAEAIPTVENIARVIWRILAPKVQAPMRLASVTVWETPKTSCQYSE